VGAEGNTWVGSGSVVNDLRVGRVGNGQTVCSFQVSVPTVNSKRTVWVRVNVYDPTLIRYVRRKIHSGAMVSVSGELMNRKYRGTGPQLTEVRAHEINIGKPEE
jgi:single-stranded DNA-binding protein